MHVVLIGMGEVGRYVTQILQAERHDVVAIDIDADTIAQVEDRLDVATLVGYGASPQILRRARVQDADLLVAVTDHDEANLIAALAGKQLGAKRCIARIQGKEFDDGAEGVYYGFLGIDVVVNPRVLVAQEIAKIARSHGALDVLGVAGNRIELVEMELPARSKVLGYPLAELSLPRQTLVAAIVRDQELFVPGGADKLRAGDRVFVIGRSGEMEPVEDMFCGGREASRVCIIGGGVVGEALARNLAGADVQLLLIEKNRATAQRLAAELPQEVLVIHGDGTNVALLDEERVGSYDLVCALSHEDEVNLMSGLLAKRLGARRTIALVHRPDYTHIYQQLGIDIVLSPRQVASEQILKYARQTELQSLTLLEDGQAEMLEFVVPENSRVVGVPLKRLNFPRGALLGAIVSGENVRVPRGDDILQVGDTAVVLTTRATRREVERLFRRRLI